VFVLLALLKVSSFSDAQPYFLEMVPATPVDKAAQPAAGDGEAPGDEALDLPEADARGSVGRLLTTGFKVSNLPGRQDSMRTRKPARDEASVFYRPSSGEDRDGELVCGNLGDFPESSRVVFPLPKDYFDSYEDTWGAFAGWSRGHRPHEPYRDAGSRDHRRHHRPGEGLERERLEQAGRLHGDARGRL
jgi:hypothetical protein